MIRQHVAQRHIVGDMSEANLKKGGSNNE